MLGHPLHEREPGGRHVVGEPGFLSWGLQDGRNQGGQHADRLDGSGARGRVGEHRIGARAGIGEDLEDERRRLGRRGKLPERVERPEPHQRGRIAGHARGADRGEARRIAGQGPHGVHPHARRRVLQGPVHQGHRGRIRRRTVEGPER